MDLDYSIMLDLTEIELKLRGLKKAYSKKYFKKNIRPWSFKCYHCAKKVSSSKANEYWIISMTWKNISTSTCHFCSNDCSEIYYREQVNELLKQQDNFIEDRNLLREFYSQAERKFLESRAKTE